MDNLWIIYGYDMVDIPFGFIKHGWLENEQFIGDFPNKTSISRGSSIAMFDYQRVSRSYHDWGWFIAAMYGDARDGLLLG